MKRLAVVNVVGLTKALIGNHTPNIADYLSQNSTVYLQEPFPAVTCTSQSEMVTGQSAAHHGIVGNGWYFKDLAEVGFWKQNDGLAQGPKIWETLKEQWPDFTCAKIFWWYNMYSRVDWSITPRPQYPADGRKVFGVYSQPYEMASAIEAELGKFPFMNFWGPAAGLPSSRWIADCAQWIYRNYKPNLNLVYLPHLDYCLQKFGPDAKTNAGELRAIDKVVGDLLSFYRKQGVSVMLLSEYGITEVFSHSHPNRILREAGYLKVIPSLSWELIDAGASRAFAVSDHQICHIYVKNPGEIEAVAALFKQDLRNQEVIFGPRRAELGLDHPRAGDVILMATPQHWYTYYYWLDDSRAPDFARCVDIHRKPGYDPAEMFLDPDLMFPRLKIAWKLLRKILGFRMYMDVIPLRPELIKGSHGTPVSDPARGPLLIFEKGSLPPEKTRIPMKEVYSLIERFYLQ